MNHLINTPCSGRLRVTFNHRVSNPKSTAMFPAACCFIDICDLGSEISAGDIIGVDSKPYNIFDNNYECELDL